MFFHPSHYINPEDDAPNIPPPTPRKKRHRWLLYVCIALIPLMVLGFLSPSSTSVSTPTEPSKSVMKGTDIDKVPEPWGLKLGEDLTKRFPKCIIKSSKGHPDIPENLLLPYKQYPCLRYRSAEDEHLNLHGLNP